MLENAHRARNPEPEITNEIEDTVSENENTTTVIFDEPVHVTDATFEDEVLQSDLPVMIDFWAEWCGPCRMVAPILDKMAKEFAGQLKIAKVDVDANPQLSQAFRIQSIPTLMIIKDRTMIFNQPGALPESAFRDLIQQAIDFEVPPQPVDGEAQPGDQSAQ
ncbi:MAG: thioredoxin [Chloroflexi bacterium]|nr:thioredoxin [Chloroflexota bacterium]